MFRSVFLFFVFFLSLSFHLFAADSVRIRDRGIPCGIYLSKLASPSMGEKISEINENEFKKFVLENPRLKDVKFFAVGVPLLKSERREALAMMRENLKDADLEEISVGAITKPANLLESALMFFPLREDFQMPTRGEMTPSLISWSLGTAATGLVLLSTQPLKVALPSLAINSLFSASTTFPRQSWGNYFIRSRNFPEKFAKQIMMGMVFTYGVYAAGQGNFEAAATALTLGGFVNFLSHKWSNILFQSSWRVPVEFGIPKWVRLETKAGNEQQARTYGSWYRAIATNVATPAWAYSTLTHSKWGTMLGIDWTTGHFVMVAVGAVAGAAWAYPKIYHFPIQLTEKIKEQMKTLRARQVREN